MRVLVTGASGQLGGYVLRELIGRGSEVVAWSGSRSGQVGSVPLRPVDLANGDRVAAAFREARPTVVLHAAAVASVADCFRDQPRAWQVNARGTALLAELAAHAGARLVFVSTDLVFDGERGRYTESDAPAPLSIYGRTKAAAERAALDIPNSVVVRVSLLYGPSLVGRPSFFDQQLAALREHRPVALFADEWRTPLDLATAARSLVEIARANYVGTLHVGGPERMSRLEMGQRIARCLNLDASVIVPSTRIAAPPAEPRPRDTSLDSSRWRELFGSMAWTRLEEAVSHWDVAASFQNLS
jgi:dTDP-4-dehydrorhamnose reductase